MFASNGALIGFSILAIVIWIALAFWPARVARRKGHSFVGYFILSLALLPAVVGAGLRGRRPTRSLCQPVGD